MAAFCSLLINEDTARRQAEWPAPFQLLRVLLYLRPSFFGLGQEEHIVKFSWGPSESWSGMGP